MFVYQLFYTTQHADTCTRCQRKHISTECVLAGMMRFCNLRLVLATCLAIISLVASDLQYETSMLSIGNWPQALNGDVHPDSSLSICDWAGVFCSKDNYSTVLNL